MSLQSQAPTNSAFFPSTNNLLQRGSINDEDVLSKQSTPQLHEFLYSIDQDQVYSVICWKQFVFGQFQHQQIDLLKNRTAKDSNSLAYKEKEGLFKLLVQSLRHRQHIKDIQSEMKLAKLQKRLMFLSPTVQAGWQAESYKTDFEKIKTLGQGAYGFVWQARHKKSGAIYAIKEIKKNTLTSQHLLNHVKTEVKVMYELNHPNIIKLYNHFEDDFSIYFVLEYAESGQLFDALMKAPSRKFEEKQAAKYIREIALALQYIHKKKIIHRDIKPENILIGKSDEAKLADFGWSNFTEGKNKRQTYCGTLDYLAPEMVDKAHLHDYRVDIWSLGVLIYQLCTGQSPFSSPLYSKNNLTEPQIKNNITNLNYECPKELTDHCIDIIKKILVLKPENRLEIDQILSHPWITQIAEKELNDAVQNENLQAKLKNQYGAISDPKDEQIKKLGVFSKEQIYSNSRMESILNANKQKVQEQSDKKVKKLQLRVQQLQVKSKRQDEQLRYLRSIQAQHRLCGMELTKEKEQNKKLSKKLETMAMQLQEYERIIKQYETTNKR